MQMFHRVPWIRVFVGLCFLLLIALSVGASFGVFPIWSSLRSGSLSDQELRILFDLRIPRVICCAFIGALLGCCGVISQSLMRNPLACPYTLGMSQLISLVIFSFIYLSWHSATAISGFIILLGILLFHKLNSVSIYNADFSRILILLGLAVGSFCSSVILALQFSLDGISLMQMTRWLMGSLGVVGFKPIWLLVIVFTILFIIALKKSQQLDWFIFGDEFALSRGVAVRRLTALFTMLLFLCIATVVWTVGPIGFVGLIIPHITRLLGFIRHRELLPASACLGAIYLIACDLLSRTLFSPIEIPIGVVTGIVGVPVFVYLLVSNEVRCASRKA